MTYFRAFLKATQGATAIEYALIAGIMAAAITASLILLGGDLSGRFETILTYFK